MAKTQLLPAEKMAGEIFKLMAKLAGSKKGSMRKQAEGRKGQFYVFDGANLKATLARLKTVRLAGDKEGVSLFDNSNLDVGALVRDIDNIWKVEEGNSVNKIGKKRFDDLKKQKKEVMAKTGATGAGKSGSKVYIVADYIRIKTVNTTKVNKLIIERMKASLGKDTTAKKRLDRAPIKAILGGDQYKQKGILSLEGSKTEGNFGTQLGHGEFGKPVAAMQAEAIGSWLKENRHRLSEAQALQIQQALLTIETVLKTRLDFTNVKEGELTLDAQLIVSNQLTINNSSDAQAIEQPIAAWLMAYLTQREMEGQYFGHWASPIVQTRILKLLVKGWKFPGVTVSKNYPQLNPADTQAQRKNKKGKVNQEIRIMTGWGGAGLLGKIQSFIKGEQYSKLGVKTGATGTPGKANRQMAAMIVSKANMKLSKEVAERMEYPALQYRTGRFANSVHLLTLTQTAQGLRAQYEYDMEHYGTFEPGNKQGTRARDPNRLIEQALTRATGETSGVIPTLFQKIG